METVNNTPIPERPMEVVAEMGRHESVPPGPSENSNHVEQDLDTGQAHTLASPWVRLGELFVIFEEGLRNELSSIRTELSKLQSNASVLNDVHESNKKLSEEFHEREVLGPVFHTLIGMADRCNRQIDQPVQNLKVLPRVNTPGMPRPAIEARDADLIEIESRLADFGVQQYVSTFIKFDFRIHKCVERIATSDASLVGVVADRLLPGYKRFGKIVRPECVSVYVMETKQQGGKSSCPQSA